MDIMQRMDTRKNKNKTFIKRDTKIKVKCTQCGQCCLATPCFFIPFGKEKYDKDGNHSCPYLYFKNNLAVCKILEKHPELVTGFCSSTYKYKEV